MTLYNTDIAIFNQCIKYKMLILLCLSAFLAQSLADGVNINEVIDHILNGLCTELRDTGKNTLPIHNIDATKTWKKAFIRFTGELHCRDGWVGYLSSLRRTGDAILSTQNDTVLIQLSMGLSDLEAEFDKCQVKGSKLFSITQPVQITTSGPSISAQVSLQRNENSCISRLDYANLDELRHIKLKTGDNVLHQMQDFILNLITKVCHSQIKKSLNNKLVEVLRKEIDKGDLCRKLQL